MISRNLSAGEENSSGSADKVKPGETNEKLYDLSMVRSVSGGDETFIKKMVALFIETVPPNVSQLIDAMKTDNWDQVSKLAHKLKSTVDSMGIKSLKTEIRTVEANAKQKVLLDEIPALVQKIEMVISNCVGQLKVDFME